MAKQNWEGAPSKTACSKTAWRRRAALASGGLGFVAGAVFWHLVGFGSVLSAGGIDRTTASSAAAVTTATTLPAAGLRTILVVDSDRCTALALDRGSNSTMAHPCPQDGLSLRLEPDARVRDDLAVLTQPRPQAVGYRAD